MTFTNRLKRILGFISVTLFAFACTKTDISFGNTENEADPGIIYLDNYPVDISTFKIDSFITSGNSVLSTGFFKDSAFGTINASSYAEFLLPATNSVSTQNVTFDSIALVLSPSGKYYGDTMLPVKIQASALTENVKNEDESNTTFYNTRELNRSTVALGSITTLMRPQKGAPITIRLNDNFGIELLNKLRTNASEIRSQSEFIKYFKGLYISVDSSISNSLYYFNLADSNSAIRIYYKLHGLQFESKKIDFKINTTNQFNHITGNHTNSNLAVFTPNKTQVKSSKLTGNKAFIHSNLGTRIKISFPTLEKLKEYGNYIKIIKAELIIKPGAGTYKYPHKLPETLSIYIADENNSLVAVDTEGNSINGNLQVDYLYGEKTQYAFDITNLIQNMIMAGRFSKYDLMLTNSSLFSSGVTERLIINDQSQANDISLKLHILGL